MRAFRSLWLSKPFDFFLVILSVVLWGVALGNVPRKTLIRPPFTTHDHTLQ